jgi:CubicO group peptidase (beta-lactamase class C family)
LKVSQSIINDPALKYKLTAFLLFLSFLRGYSQVEKAEAEVSAIMEEHQAVGLSVAVVKDGAVVYTMAFGLKDIESNTPLRENDIFRIASISKSFSATAMMQLVEAKKVSLDDDFSDLVGFKVRNPKYPDTRITLRMVLSHTSSINDSQGYFNFDVINPAANTDWAKCYNDYAPGKGYQYCNLNFNMVGAVIERLTGERFDTYIKKQILNPLQLNAGYCVDSLDNRLFATLYEYVADSGFHASPMAYAPRREEISNYVMGYSTPIFSPTGGMKISAPDLARYMIMHMNKGSYDGGRIISKKSARTMQTTIAKEQGYGLALTNTEKLIQGITMTGHTGSAYGLYSAMFFHPKEKFGFVVITNGCKPSYTEGYVTVLRKTINALYENLIRSQMQEGPGTAR